MALKPTVFVDMDGVLVDFIGGVGKHYGIDLSKHTAWEFDYKKQFKKTAAEFWEDLDNDFWAALDPLPWMDDLMRYLDFFNPVILSCPSNCTASGKERWIAKHLPTLFAKGRYLLGRDKTVCAHPGAILIDDYPPYITKFQEAGGKGVLFPAPWNGQSVNSKYPLPSVFESFDKVYSRILIGA